MIIFLALNWLGYNIGMTVCRMMLAATNYLNATPSPGDKPNRVHAAHNGCLGGLECAHDRVRARGWIDYPPSVPRAAMDA